MDWAKHNKCWLSEKFNYEQIQAFSELLIDLDKDLKESADFHGIEYIDIGTNTVDEAAKQVLDFINNEKMSKKVLDLT